MRANLRPQMTAARRMDREPTSSWASPQMAEDRYGLPRSTASADAVDAYVGSRLDRRPTVFRRLGG